MKGTCGGLASVQLWPVPGGQHTQRCGGAKPDTLGPGRSGQCGWPWLCRWHRGPSGPICGCSFWVTQLPWVHPCRPAGPSYSCPMAALASALPQSPAPVHLRARQVTSRGRQPSGKPCMVALLAAALESFPGVFSCAVLAASVF